MEGVLILLGILWLLGIFRGFVIPVTVKHEVNIKNAGETQRKTSNEKPKTVTSGRYGLNDAEDVDFEEIK